MAKGIVYILTNPSLDGWVKIGMSNKNDIESRLAALNRPTNLPLSYRAYAVYEVENPKMVEKEIHCLFDIINKDLHAIEILTNGRKRKREFFRISSEEAFKAFMSISRLRGDEDNLKLSIPSEEQLEEEQIAERTANRLNFKFSMLQLPVGTELTFLYDDAYICYSKDMDNKVEYEGVEYSLTALAQKLLVEKRGWKEGVSVAGPKFFMYQNNTLADLRNMFENREEVDNG
jgi:T5orf172 domain.